MQGIQVQFLVRELDPTCWNWKSSAAAAAKWLQSCLTLCDPIDGSPPTPPSLGLSRQEHWSGLPFPSPMHETEKWKWSLSVVSDSWRPHGPQPTRLLRPWDFPGKSTGMGCHCLLREQDPRDAKGQGGLAQSMWSQRVVHNWVTKQQQQILYSNELCTF